MRNTFAELRIAVRARRGFRAFVGVAAFMFVFCLVGLFMPINNGVPLWSSDDVNGCEGTIYSNLFNKDHRILSRPTDCRNAAESQVTKLGTIAVVSAIAPFIILWVNKVEDDDVSSPLGGPPSREDQ